jgi:hypothetical protein
MAGKYGQYIGVFGANSSLSTTDDGYMEDESSEASMGDPNSKENKLAAMYFSRIMSMQNSAALSHRYQQDKKLSTHLALGDFYDELDGFLDDLVESYQGYYNVQLPITCTGYKLTEPAKEIREFCDFLCDNRGFCDCSFIQNQIDEIIQLTAKTLYKLNFVN